MLLARSIARTWIVAVLRHSAAVFHCDAGHAAGIGDDDRHCQSA
jgi:hypothetical protein